MSILIPSLHPYSSAPSIHCRAHQSSTPGNFVLQRQSSLKHWSLAPSCGVHFIPRGTASGRQGGGWRGGVFSVELTGWMEVQERILGKKGLRGLAGSIRWARSNQKRHNLIPWVNQPGAGCPAHPNTWLLPGPDLQRWVPLQPMPVSLRMSNQNMIMNNSEVLNIYLFLMGIAKNQMT